MALKRRLMEFAHRNYSNMASKIPGGYAPLPPLIVIELTNKCNLRCKMCPWYGPGGTLPDLSGELTLEEIKNILADLKKSYKARLPFIGLIGGEPMLRTYFIEIIKELKQKGFNYSVTSNFTVMSDNILDAFAKYRPSDLRVSIDGPEAVHDRIRGIKGTYNKVISFINKIKQDERTRQIPIRINCTISPDNVGHIPEFAETIFKMDNVALNFQHLMFLDDAAIKRHDLFFYRIFGCKVPTGATTTMLTKEDVAALKTDLDKVFAAAKKYRKRISFVPNIPIKDIERYYLDMKYIPADKCTYPWAAARIDPLGDVRHCFAYVIGNVKEKQFKDIWNSERARYFRNQLKKYKLFPGCVRCCKM